MIWTDAKIAKLKELCYQGKSNKDIAAYLDCKVSDVYSKRSALGITIDKCKGIAPSPEFEKALVPTKQSGGTHKDVKQAFKALFDALLVATARDETGLEEAKLYSELSRILLDIESLVDTALQMRKVR